MVVRLVKVVGVVGVLRVNSKFKRQNLESKLKGAAEENLKKSYRQLLVHFLLTS